MRNFVALFALLSTFFVTSIVMMPSAHAEQAFKGDSFRQVFYYTAAGKGAKSGLNAANAKAIASGDLMSIEPGMVISKVYVVLDTAVTGATALNLGDDDSANGFVPTASITLATPAMYAWSSENQGTYLKTGTGNAPNAKFYSAAGKEVKLAVTGTATAGAFRVVVEGYKLGPAS